MKTVPNNEHFTTNYLPQGGLMGPWAAYLIDNFTRFRWQDPLLNLTLGGHCSGTNLGCILYFTGPTRFFETMKDSFLKKILTVGFDSDGRSFHQNSIEMMKAETTNQIQKHWISQNLQTFSIKFQYKHCSTLRFKHASFPFILPSNRYHLTLMQLYRFISFLILSWSGFHSGLRVCI